MHSNQAEFAVKSLKDGSGFWPAYLLLELTTRCNLRCIMCAINQDPRIQKGGEWYGDLDMRVFKNLEPVLPKINRVDLNGHGESLMNRHFLQILEKVKQSGPYVGLTTNALMINDDVASAIVQNRMDELIISIHAAEANLYAEISRQGRLEKVLSNIRNINKYKNIYQTNLPILKFQFVGMKRNVSHLEKMVELAKEIGIIELVVLPLAEYELAQGESLINCPDLIRKYFPPAIERANNLGLKLNLPQLYLDILSTDNRSKTKKQRTVNLKTSLRDFLRNKAKSLYHVLTQSSLHRGIVRNCLDPWDFAFVMQGGRIRPCCIIEENMGNLFTQTFEGIWFGEKYRLLRRRILENNPPKECTTCINRSLTTLSHLKSRVASKLAGPPWIRRKWLKK